MLTFTDEEFRAAIERDAGIKPAWTAEAFTDVEHDVRESIARIAESPFIQHQKSVRGFVCEIETGRLREIL
jgi:carbonic anhydrase